MITRDEAIGAIVLFLFGVVVIGVALYTIWCFVQVILLGE